MTSPVVPSSPVDAVTAPAPGSSCRPCALDHARVLDLAPHSQRPQVGRPEDAADQLSPLLAGRDRERCVLLALDRKHRQIAVTTVSVGTADHTFMSPREIFRDALLAGASAIVVAHNHPSGDPTPSADDREVTRRLDRAGSTLGIELLDHLVVGDDGWVSLARLGCC